MNKSCKNSDKLAVTPDQISISDYNYAPVPAQTPIVGVDNQNRFFVRK